MSLVLSAEKSIVGSHIDQTFALIAGRRWTANNLSKISLQLSPATLGDSENAHQQPCNYCGATVSLFKKRFTKVTAPICRKIKPFHTSILSEKINRKA